MTTTPTTEPDLLAGISIGMKGRIVHCWRDLAELSGIDALPVDPVPGEVASLTFKYSVAAIEQRTREFRLSVDERGYLDEAASRAQYRKAMESGRGLEIMCGPSGKWAPMSCDCESSQYHASLEHVEDAQYAVDACKHVIVACLIANQLQAALHTMEREVKRDAALRKARKAKAARYRRMAAKAARAAAKKNLATA